MKKAAIVLLAILFSQAVKAQNCGDDTCPFRPPSVPLVTHDPYFSIWSPCDRLTDLETVHWTGTKNPLHSMLRIDGKAYRIMGSSPSNIEPMKQLSLKVLPLTTIYEFGNSIVRVTLTFCSPLMVKDPDLLSRPVTYLTWKIEPADNQPHQIQVYFDLGSELAVNTTDQAVTWEQGDIEGLKFIRTGTADQKYLNRAGDNVRIDWGYAYLAVPGYQGAALSAAPRNTLLGSFSGTGKIPVSEPKAEPEKVRDGYLSLAAEWDLGITKSAATVWAMIAYDDIYSIKYFDSDLKAWWKRSGMSFNEMLAMASIDYSSVTANCESFNNDLMTDLGNAGGKKYAQMCALAFRQCMAAQKLVADKNGNPLLFPKENFSNGCIATVDVIYPFSPFALLFSPLLSKAMLEPVLDYAQSDRWKFPFAPHDIGTYPFATGQVYGGGEKDETDQMPVEETGNMIIMLAALAKAEGNAEFAKHYWPLIEKWSGYLLSKGFDPENQLCTDDFAGHLAHNVNLSAKAIIAIAAYSKLCEMIGYKDKAAEIRKKAENMATDWVKLATEGDHTLLAYDQKNTWSQKYNLVWDKLLGLHLFPESVFRKEVDFYKKMQAEFGLPLDIRERYSKNDWITWSATLADNINDFRTIFDPVYHFADKTPDRVPVTDWYIVDNARKVGFQARSVVGGYFIRMLSDPDTWKKWSAETLKK